MGSTKTDRKRAEPAAERYAIDVLGCVVTVRAVATKFQRQDMFSSDVLGKLPDGRLVAIQVTAAESQECVRRRRRGLDGLPWADTDIVLLLQWVSMPDPANQQRKQKWFKVHRFNTTTKKWTTDKTAVLIPRDWYEIVRSSHEQ